MTQLTEELERLPAEIAALPVDCVRLSDAPLDEGRGD
jgi:hypothetical protein